MTPHIDELVSVTLNFDHKEKTVFPTEVTWNHKSYPILKIGLHHTFKRGDTLFHTFSVESETTFFKLVLNTGNLHWKLEEIYTPN